jgi:hypothetical protein
MLSSILSGVIVGAKTYGVADLGENGPTGAGVMKATQIRAEIANQVVSQNAST